MKSQELYQIKHEASITKGAFFIELDGEKQAEMTYSKAGEGLIIIDHTEVSDQLRGQGVGAKLVHQAVIMARKKGIRIMSLCPFAKSVFKKTPEYQDVLN